jgi:hypothetical protein
VAGSLSPRRRCSRGRWPAASTFCAATCSLCAARPCFAKVPQRPVGTCMRQSRQARTDTTLLTQEKSRGDRDAGRRERRGSNSLACRPSRTAGLLAKQNQRPASPHRSTNPLAHSRLRRGGEVAIELETTGTSTPHHTAAALAVCVCAVGVVLLVHAFGA